MLTVVLIVTTVLGPLITLWLENNNDKDLARTNDRREQNLLRIIAEQNDRIMFMSGATWTPPPRPEVEEPVEEFDPDWKEV